MAVKNGIADEALGNLYPFEDHYVTLDDGHTMHYVDMGRAGLGRPTVLLLHGNPTWSFLYRDWIAQLSKVARVIAVDHMGFGRSDHPTDAAYYTLEQHIQNLEEFATKLRLKRVVPVVQDWGGPIGLGWATRHPDKLAGLVILNTWAFAAHGAPQLPLWFKAMKAPRVGEFLFGKKNAFVEQMIPKLLVATPSKEVMDGYRHPFPTPSSRAGVVAFPRMIPTNPKHPEWDTMLEIEQGLRALTVPAQILWGTKDPAFPKRYAHLFHELLPGAIAPEWFEDAGHYLQEDIPAKLVDRVKEFLRAL